MGLHIQEVTDVARSEVLFPTWSMTGQLLSENRVVLENGVPVVEDVIFSEDHIAAVWFPIVDESYYFIVYVNCTSVPELHWVEMSAGSKVYLDVGSEEHTLEELTGKLQNVEFSRTWSKGEVSKQSPRGDILWEDSGFEIEPCTKKTGEVEDKVNSIVEIIKSHKDDFRELSQRAYMILHIAYFGYKDQMWGIHFDSEVMRQLGELGVALDIDLYASGPNLGDSDMG